MMYPDVTRLSTEDLVPTGTRARDDQLRALADGALRRAARATRVEETVDADVRALIGHVCVAARGSGVRAEQLIVLMKESWWALPEGRRLTRANAGEMLSLLVTACITEYYARAD